MALLEIKSTRDVAKMREAGRIVATVLSEIMAIARPGLTTADLDAHAEGRCRDFGVTPAFKGYYGFPACICTSINNEVVHGIPSPRRKLAPGDILKVDFGAIYDGWHGDSCVTIGLEPLTAEARRLIAVAEEALMRGIAQVRHNAYLQEISGAIQDYVEANGFSVVRQYVGHGVGRKLHEEPQVPNFRTREIPNPRLKAGMTLAIEPMVNVGHHATRTLADRWTVVTLDKSLSAQFEHTVLVARDGYEILTDRSRL
ncbi:type I methionyl aminopeptidase [Gloeobacter kilaueensis]|uniref:Methionine aminopeptidase n=1 Tax=Gloeobacter kilaueensis (strain ATCC BAA-2537 / CCAP 1431/1 / ULC 316 / JS1) TaxID=1183438 RepID=U5QJJ2_GLOK1|nr:type I methionyl aminopeptidase [Gloeobacter kilaueensis]AGY57805.1 methionine aminopeptidase [Gloeobacter kilaueensis JS1]